MNPGHKKILCVEDDRDDYLLLRQSIQQLQNIEMEHAYNGAEALTLLEKQKQTQNLPNLIVMDLNMPAVNGRDAINEIKKDKVLKAIPVVIFSTSVSTPDHDWLKSQDIESILKPHNWSSYAEIAKRLLAYCENGNGNGRSNDRDNGLA